MNNNTQNSLEKDLHAIWGIRTRNLSKQAAVDRAATGIGN